MKTVKKFTSFEDLKSSEKESVNYKLSLKRHNDFEKAIKIIYAVKNEKLITTNLISAV